MNHKKRAFVLLLAGLLLTGCAGTNAGTEDSAAAESTASSAVTSTAENTQEASTKESSTKSNRGNRSSKSSDAQTLTYDGTSQMDEVNASLVPADIDDDYRTTYEIFVYSFYDSDGDGIGDLKGVTQKLDYINDGDPETTTDLGATQIWLMPIFKSPTYHKYDTADYETIDPQYGTMDDFDELLSACHTRGIRVILDLAVNHTSVENEWFVKAKDYLKTLGEDEEPDDSVCPYVDYYNFSWEKQDGYENLSGTNWYYEARFWSGMPDLNLDSDAVRSEISDITKFWLDKGVDGFRLDAMTSYYTDDSTKSIEFTKWLTDTVKGQNPNAYLVGECWDDQSVYATYYQSGIDSLFDFQFAGQEGTIAKTVQGKISAQSFSDQMMKEEVLYSSYNMDYVNAPFYTNHDMARSAGYYAGDDGSKTKLAGGLNLLMTGDAFVYYGEEIGMKGSGKDEDKRAPMYWTQDANSDGMTVGPPDMDTVTMKYDPEDVQTSDPTSILSYYRNAIRIRNAFPVIARGSTETVSGISGDDICAFTRTMADDSLDPVLVVINCSDSEQSVDLSADTASSDYADLAAVLTVSSDAITLSGSTLTLPAYGTAILTK